MRLRIQTAPPLPPLKIWFTPEFPSPDVPNLNASITNSNTVPTTRTIYDLKKSLCEHVPTLSHDVRCRAESIVLSLDEFELMDRTPFAAGVVRDGDLVVVGLDASKVLVKPELVDCKPLKLELELEPEVVVVGHKRANGNKRKRSEQVSCSVPNPPGLASFPAPAPSTKRPRAEPAPEASLDPSVPPQEPQKLQKPQCNTLSADNNLGGTTSSDTRKGGTWTTPAEASESLDKVGKARPAPIAAPRRSTRSSINPVNPKPAEATPASTSKSALPAHSPRTPPRRPTTDRPSAPPKPKKRNLKPRPTPSESRASGREQLDQILSWFEDIETELPLAS